MIWQPDKAMSAAAQGAPSVASLKEKPALKVWAYEVPGRVRNDGFFVSMPAGARVLGVERNPAALCAQIFALVNPEMAEEQRFFYVAQTNFPLPEARNAETNPPGLRFAGLEYVGTWVAHGQTLHLFECVVDQSEREPGEEE